MDWTFTLLVLVIVGLGSFALYGVVLVINCMLLPGFIAATLLGELESETEELHK